MQKHVPLLSLLAVGSLFVVAVAAVAPGQAAQREQPIRVLVVTGANNHDWQATTPVMTRALENAGCVVSVSEDPQAPVLASPDLAENFDAVLLNYNGPDWSEEVQHGLVDFVRHGGGLVIIHAANNAFGGWTEYNEMIGVGWRAGAGHGSFHPFNVEVVDREHPITRDMPEVVPHAADELYHRLTGPYLDAEPPAETRYTLLARAYSDPDTGGTGEHEPMAIAVEYYDGRVFHTPLGHAASSMEDPVFRAFLTRGTEWAATGEVTLELPEDLTAAAE